MEIINFEEAKARRLSKDKTSRHSLEHDNGVLELQRQHQELAKFYNQWYDEHVVGQDENGRWIYKD